MDTKNKRVVFHSINNDAINLSVKSKECISENLTSFFPIF